MNLLLAAVLGIVEGLTEFIPVSSTGHLILAGNLLHFTGDLAGTFEIFIQLGAILAVLLFYRRRFMDLLNLRLNEGFQGRKGILLLLLTTAPALLLGFMTHHVIKEKLFSPLTVAIGLAAGGLWILLTERLVKGAGKQGLDSLGWKDALAVGLFQCLALWPGMSRSASTILGAMIVGIDRRTATEYSFFAAVPVLFAAAGLDLIKNRHLLHAADMPFFACGFLTAFVFAWLSIRFLVGYVSKNSLKPFGWYRIALAAVTFLVL